MDSINCKNCKEDKPIKDFGKKRRVCKKCRYVLRKDYMKNYYKTHYIPKRKPKDENAPEPE